ncbi:MAG TPA: ribosome-associated translation inhibitor RaiA [Candidatus Binataceae bacterium]|nr:ribosome-associated translation inhibitor RaiA [Candidatus Binataceae bacterium]
MRSKPGNKKPSRPAAAKSHTTPAARARAAAQTSVVVTFRHLEPSDALRRYAERKLSHLGKYAKRACAAHLILSVDKYRQHGEVTVKSGRISVTAEQESKDLYVVIDRLADKVVGQLKRHLEKITARKTRSPSTGEVLSAAEEIEPFDVERE